MQTKKTPMLAAGLVVAILALAGVGYATTAYTATTTNGGNTLDSAYIELSQEGTASYTASSFLQKIYYDTTDTSASQSSHSFRYDVKQTHLFNGSNTFTESAEAPVDTQTAWQLVGDNLVLKANATQAAQGSTYALSVTVSGLNVPQGMSFKILLGTESEGVITVTGSAIANLTSGEISLGAINSIPVDGWNVYVFASGSTTTAPADQSNVSFAFKLTATVA